MTSINDYNCVSMTNNNINILLVHNILRLALSFTYKKIIRDIEHVFLISFRCKIKFTI